MNDSRPVQHVVEKLDRGFIEYWYCDQPECYVVTDQEWRENYTERHVYAVRETS